ncbi:MAG TPA: DUF4394 domain-containing protein [Blastocatellia bacterium]|nr:DUF4394 domain-containing protein [Blastocatellia bacterium]
MRKKFMMLMIIMVMISSGVLAQQGNRQNRNDHDKHDGNDKEKRDRGLKIFALTSDQRLIRFYEDDPSDSKSVGTVSGLDTDETLVGIDFRVQDGLLYGLGSKGNIYTINTTDATAVFVNALTVALDGTAFAIDFNPAADRLRIVSNTGQNLRHDVTAGATTEDADLNYPTDPPTTATDVAGIAYTNNDVDPDTATTLYDIDANLDQVVIQSPPNTGALAATGKLTVDTTPVVGFDIYSVISDGVAVGTKAFASLTTDQGKVKLYEIDLLTGKATKRGKFNTDDQVIDLAIPLDQH